MVMIPLIVLMDKLSPLVTLAMVVVAESAQAMVSELEAGVEYVNPPVLVYVPAAKLMVLARPFPWALVRAL